jgi:GDSL/SGNH-like Acyl-Esterase family found in Pmr5 and Cas1p
MRFITTFLIFTLYFENQTSQEIKGYTPRKCELTGYSKGSWVFNSNKTNKSFICCSFKDEEHLNNNLYCTRSTDIKRKIRPKVSRAHMNHFSVKQFGQLSEQACRCDYDNSTSVHPREQYEWQTSNGCAFEWDSEEFCSYLGDRTMMMIGDSTVISNCKSHINMLIAGDQDCANQIICVRHDYLLYSEKFTFAEDKLNFTDYVDMYSPDIVLMSTGLHYVRSSLRFFLNETIHSIVKMIDSLKLQFAATDRPLPIFYWMQLNNGHTGCEMVTEPLKILPDFESGINDTYGWQYLDVFDRLAKDLFLKNGNHYLDLSPLRYRADAHPSSGWKMKNAEERGKGWYLDYKIPTDCLHYCVPGPLDAFSSILQINLRHIFERSNASKANYTYLPVGSLLDTSNRSSVLLSMADDCVIHCMGNDCPRSDDFYYANHGVLRKFPNKDTILYHKFTMEEIEYFAFKEISAAPKGDAIEPCPIDKC